MKNRARLTARNLAVVILSIILTQACSLTAQTLPEEQSTQAAALATDGIPQTGVETATAQPLATLAATPRPSQTISPDATLTITLTATTASSPTPPPTQTVAVVSVQSQVRRLNDQVFTGSRQPLNLLSQQGFINLDPGGLITTDLNGEAEVVIDGCLKIFVFQLSGLQRSACRRADQESGLAACATAGITTVVNQCLSQVTIQSPSSTVITNGTMFSIIYLPEDQISLVQVYEGSVDVSALMESSTGQMSEPSVLGEDNLWWTSPDNRRDNINGIPPREAQPMDVWEAIRPELIVQYPYLDTWMNSTRDVIEAQNQDFQEFLTKPDGFLQMHAVGPAFDEQLEFDFLSQGVWWSLMEQNLWPDTNVRFRVTTGAGVMEDARIMRYDQAAAQGLVTSTSFEDFGYQIWIGVDGNDPYAGSIYNELSSAFTELGLNPQIYYYYDQDSLQATINTAETGDSPPLFWVENSQNAIP